MYGLDKMSLEILIDYMYINRTYALNKENRKHAGILTTK